MRQLPIDFRTPLSLASEKTLKDLKGSQGRQRGGEESGFGELGPPDFTEMIYKGTYLYSNYVQLVRADF